MVQVSNNHECLYFSLSNYASSSFLFFEIADAKSSSYSYSSSFPLISMNISFFVWNLANASSTFLSFSSRSLFYSTRPCVERLNGIFSNAFCNSLRELSNSSSNLNRSSSVKSFKPGGTFAWSSRIYNLDIC